MSDVSPETDRTPAMPSVDEAPRSPGVAQPHLPVPVQPGERVLVLRRRHWMYLWPTILLNLLFAVVPAVAFLWLLDAAGLDGQVATIIAAVYVAIWLIRIAFIWYKYHNDYWVVTNQRVMDVKRNHPLNLQIATADLVNIQDMTIRRNGLLKTMLDYGDVVCQTAGMDSDFTIAGVHDPRAVQALVDRERDRERLRVRG